MDDANQKSCLASYQASFKNRLAPLVIAMPIFLLSIFGKAHLKRKSPLVLWLFTVSLSIFLIVSILNNTFCRITLYDDRIEKTTWFGKKTMRRDDIAKVRKHNWQTVMIVYKNNSGDGMVIPRGIGGDALWKAWMADIQGHEIFD